MRTFFHGWRRKAGVTTLELACFSVAIWNASYFVVAGIACSDFFFAAQDGEIDFIWNVDEKSFAILGVPYWAPSLLFTVLSACLILWRPQKRVNHDA